MSGGKWVGQSISRLERPRLLTGRGAFIDDLEVTNLHHAAILRSPYAHARIGKIDGRRALEVPGVLALLTGEDARDMSDPFINIAEDALDLVVVDDSRERGMRNYVSPAAVVERARAAPGPASTPGRGT